MGSVLLASHERVDPEVVEAQTCEESKHLLNTECVTVLDCLIHVGTVDSVGLPSEKEVKKMWSNRAPHATRHFEDECSPDSKMLTESQ